MGLRFTAHAVLKEEQSFVFLPEREVHLLHRVEIPIQRVLPVAILRQW